MSTAADIDAQMLARIAELDLSAAERVHAKLMLAEEAGEVAELGRTYQRMARSLRQSILMKARAAREHALVQLAAEDAALKAHLRVVDTHKARIGRAVDRRIEAEDLEEEAAERLGDAFDTWLEDEVIAEGFLDETVESHVARACRRLGLKPPEAAEPDPAQPCAGRDRSCGSASTLASDPGSARVPAGAGTSGEGEAPRPDHPFQNSA